MNYQTKKQNKMTEIIEIYGNNFTGKTLYALSLLEKNEITLYIDADCKLQNNVNYPTNTYIANINNIDIISNYIEQMITSLDAIVIDSLPV